MPMTKFVLPNDIQLVLNKIEERGHEAYIVGGCVRDLLMGRVPHDWDITTSALPEQIQLIFHGFAQVLDGLKHGTVTIILNHMPVEITTFRIDGDYSDGRRPDAISFTSDLDKDLARRDFTINACAYSSGRLIDPFGGSHDLKLETIRCVGDPVSRFAEDSLRILRGLRFASELSFSIEKQTKEAMLKCIPLLENVSQERITAELCKTLVGDNVLAVLSEYRSILLFLIPELKSSLTSITNKTNSATDYLTVSITAVSLAKKDLAVRFALLLRGLGQDAKLILHRMRLPSELIKQTLTILRYTNVPFEHTPSAVKRVLRDTGVDTFRLLLNAKTAVSEAVSNSIKVMKPDDIEIFESESDMINASNIYDPEDIASLEDILSRIINENECYNLNGLDISGNDLIDAGVPEGKQIGEMLDMLLDMVIDDMIKNNRNALINVVHNFLNTVEN